ncbi:MAG: DUF1488 domain-containing protein [Thiotrichaceae bacterium]|nr:DUF1488 domain-containing protein [Thiotrichaceae bacterium]
MKLHFPNPSRSFDESKDRICFWGYDSAMEVSFFIEADALKRLSPDMNGTERGLLGAFDNGINQIHEVAEKMYSRSPRSSAVILVEKDF